MKEQNNAIIITGIISAVILVIAFMALSSLGGSSAGVLTDNTVNVQGEAQVKAMPDLMVVYFDVETKGDTTEAARADNVEVVEKLVDGIVALGFERSEIVTENFNVRQDYDWKNGERVDKGFIASHDIKVKMAVDDTEKMGKVVDAGVSAGAMVNRINFELTQESQNKYKAEAMKIAAKDAKIKAESVAEGFDKRVGKLVNVQVQNFGYNPWRAYGGNLMADTAMIKESVSNIQPGEKDITASVSATYKLR